MIEDLPTDKELIKQLTEALTIDRELVKRLTDALIFQGELTNLVRQELEKSKTVIKELNDYIKTTYEEKKND